LLKTKESVKNRIMIARGKFFPLFSKQYLLVLQIIEKRTDPVIVKVSRNASPTGFLKKFVKELQVLKKIFQGKKIMKIRVGNQTAFSAAHFMDPFYFAIEHRFDAFEWFPDTPEKKGWEILDLDSKERAKIQKKAKENAIALSVHSPLSATPIHDAGKEKLKQALQLAKDLDAKLVVLHMDIKKGAKKFVQGLLEMEKNFLDFNVPKIAIENTKITSPQHLNDVFCELKNTQLSPYFGICFDIGHANLFSQTHHDYVGYFKQIQDNVPLFHIHLHENRGDYDSHTPFFQGPSCRDESGIRELIHLWEKRNFEGNVIMEQWPTPQDILCYTRNYFLKCIEQETSQNQKLKST
jgi:sugar phosphate isomerase/epimerase